MTVLLFALTALAADPVALVELYTSQGCSSCPPAEALLTKIDAQARQDGMPVYALSFHVDYWDRLGWKDPYGDPRWTGRQREYARAFRSDKLVTPQVVVNGSEQAIGSQEPLVKAHIAKALTQAASTRLQGTATVRDGQVHVEVTAVGAPIGGEIFIALYEPVRKNRIEKGENKGTDAVHTNVVRAMVKARAPGARGKLTVPEGVDLASAEVVAWVSDPLTMAVVGASRIEVGRPE